MNAVKGNLNETQGGSYRSVAMMGIAWSTAASIGLKFAGLISQIALGWWLSEDDFALYALAISVGSVFNAVRNGGVQRLLVQRGSEFELLASPLFFIGLLFNLTIFLGIALSATFIAQFYEAKGLTPLLLLVGATTVASTPVTVLTSKLLIDLQFKTLSKLQLVSGVFKVIATLMLAGYGFGAYSFVLPPLFAAFVEFILLYSICGIWPKGARLSKSLLADTLSASGWLGFGAIGISLSMQGDFLIVGALESKSTLAFYFFGFQLIGSFSALITANFATVLMPTFARLSNDRVRLGEAYRRSLIVVAVIASPTFILLGLISSPAIRILWDGKWDSAIIVAQLIAISASIRITTALPVYLVEAIGAWRLWCGALVVDAVGTAIAAYIGAVLGGLTTITVAVCVYRILYGLWIASVGYKVCQLGQANITFDILIPFGVAVITAAPFFGIQQYSEHLAILPALVIGYVATYYVSIRVLLPHALSLIREFIPATIKRRFSML